MRRALPCLLPLLTACGTDVSGPAPSLFSCVLTDGVALEPGQVLNVGGAANQGVCLQARPEEGAYLYVPFFARDPAGENQQEVLPVEITGHGIAAAAAAAAPSLPRAALLDAPTGAARSTYRPDAGFHRELRARERTELGARIHGGVAAPRARPRAADPRASLDLPPPGTLLDYNVAIDCDAADLRTGRVEYVSETAIVVADTANPPAMSASDFRFFGEAFDTLVDPVGTAHFGAPADIDANERIIIFFTRAVNELTGPDSETYTGGFFWSGDLFPETATERLDACPAANQAEMFYMLVADPAGEVGPEFSREFILEVGLSILAHEYQHLINASRRLYVNQATAFEEPWLNEGLSHIAEELLFYAVSGLQPGMNLGIQVLRDTPNGVDAYNRYMGPGNFTNFMRYLQEPDEASLMGVNTLPTRGASWAFLRYAADRSGRSDSAFFFDLVNGRTAGLRHLDQVLAGPALAWMQDWTVAVYADDAVTGLAPRHTQPSWDFRDIYGEVAGAYPLTVIAIAPQTEERLDLHPGGAAFPRFDVAAGSRAVLHVESGAATPPSRLRGSFLRIR